MKPWTRKRWHAARDAALVAAKNAKAEASSCKKEARLLWNTDREAAESLVASRAMALQDSIRWEDIAERLEALLGLQPAI